MMERRSQSCASCYFRKTGTNECHRYAPRPNLTYNSPLVGLTDWPETEENDWCGEWKEFK